MDSDLIILTDALGALQNLTGLQRADFARSLRFHPQGEHLARLVGAVNRRSDGRRQTTFVKIRAHRCNMLNEWADSAAQSVGGSQERA